MLIRKTQLKRPASALAAGVACAIALSLATGPAFAESEFSNRQPRGDEAKPGARRRRADRPISSRRRRPSRPQRAAAAKQIGSVGPSNAAKQATARAAATQVDSVGAVRCREAGSSAGERQAGVFSRPRLTLPSRLRRVLPLSR